MSICPQCNNQNPDGAAFCDNCGASLVGVAPPQPVAPVAPATPAAPVAPAAGMVCPSCGTPAIPGEAFCDNCGASLAAAPPPVVQPPVTPVPPPPVTPPPPVVAIRPRLVVAGTGAEFDLSGKAEIVIGREDPVSGVFPEVDLTPHGGEEGGVSRRHAKLTVRGNQWLIEDLKTTNFTFVNNQKLNPGVPQPLNNGDQIRLGRVLMTFHTA